LKGFFLACGGVNNLFVAMPYTVVLVCDGFLSGLFQTVLLSMGPVYAKIFWEL